jgi:hypothetical protein
MEAYNADHSTGYVGVNLAKLQGSYDAGIKNVTIRAATNGGYCIREHHPGNRDLPQVGPRPGHQNGPVLEPHPFGGVAPGPLPPI